jgi:phage tail-like protein
MPGFSENVGGASLNVSESGVSASYGGVGVSISSSGVSFSLGELTEDIYGGYHFLLEIETINNDEKKIIAGFNAVSGGGVKIEKRDVTTGVDRHKRHMPGSIEYDNVTLSRGFTKNQDLLDWMKATLEGDMDRRSGSIIILDNNRNELRRFNFYGAYPVSWAGPELSSDGSAVALEKFELAVERTEWE